LWKPFAPEQEALSQHYKSYLIFHRERQIDCEGHIGILERWQGWMRLGLMADALIVLFLSDRRFGIVLNR
jgi:hypothetical protein